MTRVRWQSGHAKKKLRGTVFLVDVNLTNGLLLQDILQGRVCVIDGSGETMQCLQLHMNWIVGHVRRNLP